MPVLEMRCAPLAVGYNLLVCLDLVSRHHDLVLNFRWDRIKASVVELAGVVEKVLAILQQAVDPVIRMLMLCRNLRAQGVLVKALAPTALDEF